MSTFTNLYYKRTAATERSCYMCNRSTTTVLATKDSVDFFYVCPGHLADQAFATRLGESGDGVQAQGARKLGVSEEEIRKVKEEYEERQRKKKEKEEKEKGKLKEDDKVKDRNKDKDKTVEEVDGANGTSGPGNKSSTPTTSTTSIDVKGKEKEGSTASASSAPSPPPVAKAVTVHERYVLHRAVFSIRLDVHRKRRQSSQAKEVAPHLPSAPRSPMDV